MSPSGRRQGRSLSAWSLALLGLASPAAASYDIVNTATVYCTNGQGVAQPPRFSSTTFTVNVAPLLTLIKSASATDLAAGQDTVFAFQLQNVGNDPARNVVVMDTLPAELAYVAGTASPAPAATGAVVRWDLGNLPPGTYNLSFTARAQAVGVDTLATNRAAALYEAAGGVTLAPALSATTVMVRSLAAPGVPGSLTAMGVGTGALLSWLPAAAGTFPVSGYNIYRATYAGFAVGPATFLAQTLGLTATAYTDVFITAGVRTYYTVRAVDGTGLEGGSAPVVSVLRPGPVTPPPPPGGGPVRLIVAIYDETGRLIRTLEDVHVAAAVTVVRVGDGSGHLAAEAGQPVLVTLSDGSTVSWDGRDAGGGLAPNGIYSARATSELPDGRSEVTSASFTMTHVYGHLITAAAMVPNPADDVAWIAFTLASSSATLDIKVYNVSGELVHRGTAPGTARSYRWPLRNQLGTPVAEGMYAVVIEAFDPATGDRQREVMKLAVSHGTK